MVMVGLFLLRDNYSATLEPVWQIVLQLVLVRMYNDIDDFTISQDAKNYFIPMLYLVCFCSFFSSAFPFSIHRIFISVIIILLLCAILICSFNVYSNSHGHLVLADYMLFNRGKNACMYECTKVLI